MNIIGEKINGTRKEIAQAIKDRDTSVMERLAVAQTEAGASWLDVNAGTNPNREPEDLIWLVETIQKVVETPGPLSRTGTVAHAQGEDTAMSEDPQHRPPYSSGMQASMRPSSASSAKRSRGNTPSRSHPHARGTIFSWANSRVMCWMSR
ncbi:MAG: hypothetical protein ACYC5Q_04825 [Thermoleophilia bacterium]